MERPYEDGKGHKTLDIPIQPGQTCKIPFTPKATSSGELAVAAVYEHPFYVIGTLMYMDAQGTRRETAFCRQVDHEVARKVVVDDPDYEYAH
jgi:hypothetical protein